MGRIWDTFLAKGTLRCSERALLRGTVRPCSLFFFWVQRGDEDAFFTGIQWDLGIEWDFSWGFDGNFMVLRRDLAGINGDLVGS